MVLAGFGDSVGDANYHAAADADANGTIDLADLNAVLNYTTTQRGQLSALGNTISFGGAPYDQLFELSHMRNRWYSPWLGRWITRDPAGYVDGMSQYLYVKGNPLVYFDPFGLDSKISKENFKRSMWGVYKGDHAATVYAPNPNGPGIIGTTPMYSVGHQLWGDYAEPKLVGEKVVTYKFVEDGPPIYDKKTGELTDLGEELIYRRDKDVEMFDAAQNTILGEAAMQVASGGLLLATRLL